MLSAQLLATTMYFIGRITLFFANNSLTECQITMEFLHIFLDPEVIFSSHTMFINASTKEFTLCLLSINAITSYDIAFEHLLCYKLVAHAYHIPFQFDNRLLSC